MVSASASALRTILARAQDAGLYTHAYGEAGRLEASAPVVQVALLPDGRDLFDLASLTKALATTPLVWQALDAAGLSVETTLAAWLMASRAASAAAVLQAAAPPLLQLTVRQLLSHRSGLPGWRNFWVCTLGSQASPKSREALIADLNRTAGELPARPQDKCNEVYSDVGFILLGLVLEATTGQSLAQLFAEFCRVKLHRDAATWPLTYHPLALPDLIERAVPTTYCLVRQRPLIGEVHDENCAALGGAAGHAGLFGSGPAVGQFLRALAQAPLGQSLLAANSAERTWPIEAGGRDGLLGWRRGTVASALPFGAGAAIGHLGFTGTAFWLWPERGEYAILLTNRVVSGRLNPAIGPLRTEVFTELARVLADDAAHGYQE